MRVTLDNQLVSLNPSQLLGVGGEAQVFRVGDRAVKVYHPIDPSLQGTQRRVAERLYRRRLEKLRAFPKRLPTTVVGPIALAKDERNREVVGFVMKVIENAEPLRRLTQRKWREGVISNEAVCDIFGRLRATLTEIHRRRVVVGDLNDTNILLSGLTPYLIDADSVQFGDFPCEVGHQRTLDPSLYGVDLFEKPVFTENTDWYAFCVLLFSSLLYTHPYGGVCPDHPTLLRRAQARHSVFRPDVRYPKAAVHFRVLPDGLLDYFEKTFDGGFRERFPADLLSMRWTHCRCGLTHARSRCPSCTQTIAPKTATVVSGRCRANRIFHTTGRILTAAFQGQLQVVYLEDGVCRREDGSAVFLDSLEPGMRFALSNRSTWVGFQQQLVEVRDERPRQRASSDTIGLSSIFDANSSTCFSASGGWLVDLNKGSRIGQILENQTWFRAGEELGVGFYQAGLMRVFFLFEPGRSGLRRIELPTPKGRLLDTYAAFDRQRVLLEMNIEQDGTNRRFLFVVASDGALLADSTGLAESSPALASSGGKAILENHVLCPTDDGLLSLLIDPIHQTLIEQRSFPDTEPFITAQSVVLPAPGGSVFIVNAQDIVHLTLT